MTRTSSASRLFKAHYLLTVCRFEGRRSISRPHRTSCAIRRLFQTRGYHAAAMKVRFQVMLNLGNGGGGKAAVEVRLQSVTGELPFVEMLPGKKKKKVNAT